MNTKKSRSGKDSRILRNRKEQSEKSLRFVQTDGGRSESRHPSESSDCTVIALALAAGVSYDAAHEFLKRSGRKTGAGFYDWSGFMNRQTEIFGLFVIKHPFPPQKNQPRMNGRIFVEKFRSGRFIVKQSEHVAAVIDGIVYDSRPFDFNRCVYTAHEFISS